MRNALEEEIQVDGKNINQFKLTVWLKMFVINWL
jgi:hypothetical protein